MFTERLLGGKKASCRQENRTYDLWGGSAQPAATVACVGVTGETQVGPEETRVMVAAYPR